jgi:hypothetical protein
VPRLHGAYPPRVPSSTSHNQLRQPFRRLMIDSG